jgi:O-antigen biosynthesis protein WbqP
MYRYLKASIDFLLSLISLIVLIPFFILVVIGIKIDSKGPAFFKQKRIGEKRKRFT